MTNRFARILTVIFSIVTGAMGQVPTITSFTPTSGPLGTTVTISGTNFSSTPSNNAVYFGAVRATVNSATTTLLTVTVPKGATYQPITVTNLTAGLTAYSAAPFNVTFPSIRVIDTTSFAAKVDVTFENGPYGVSIADIDGDGKPDVAVANQGSNTISILRNTSTSGSVSFAAKVDVTVGSNPDGVAIADIDGDGKPDVAVANNNSNTVSVLRNTSISGSVSFAAKVDVAVGSFPGGTAIADIDADGKPDVVVANQSSDVVSVLRNTSTSGTISFAANVDVAVGRVPWGVTIADIDGDAKYDVVVGNENSNKVSILRNTSTSGSISFAAKADFPVGSYPYGVAVADIDGDGKPDVGVANYSSRTVSILRNTSAVGSISFETKVDSTVGGLPYGVAIADIDGDGKPDVVVPNRGTNTASILRNTSTNGNVSFATKVDFAVGSIAYGAAIGDIDGDGKPDVTVTNYYSNTVSVLRNSIPYPLAISEKEPNDSARTANEIVFGDTVRGSINPTGDKDYYKFVMTPQDTVEFFLKLTGSSTLQAYIELFDSVGNGISNPGDNYVYAGFTAHAFGVPYGYSGNAFARIRWRNTPAIFPSTPGGGNGPGIPAIQAGGAGIASSDTGSYELRFRRFVSSKPTGSYGGTNNLINNSAVFYGGSFLNGSTISAIFQYGTSTAYGNTIAAIGSPFGPSLGGQGFNAVATGLLPNTTYHVRLIVSATTGADTTADFPFVTPPAAAQNWTAQATGNWDNYTAVKYLTQNTRLISSNRVMRTTDAGSNWTFTSYSWNNMYDMAFTDTLNGYGASWGSVWRTVDGGLTWTGPNSIASSWLRGISFADANNGLVVGSGGAIFRTTNAGASWTSQTSGTTSFLLKVRHVTASVAYAAGDQGIVLKTTNGGASWTTLSSPTQGGYAINDVWFFDASNGFAVTYDAIYRTTNGGTSWSMQSMGTGKWMNAIAFSSPLHGLLVGDGGTLLRTNDGGSTWKKEETGTFNPLAALWVGGYNKAMVVGYNGSVLVAVDAPPSAPQYLTAIPATGQVTLKWNKNTELDLMRYRVYKGTSPAPTAKIDSTTLGAADTSKLITGLTGISPYYFRVTAVDSAGNESQYSNEVSIVAVPAPPAPQNLSATLVNGQITLKWNKVVDANFLRYLIYRSTAPVPITRVDSTTGGNTDTSKIHTGLTPGTRYYYRVTAQNTYLNQSLFSNEVSVVFARNSIAEAEPNDSASVATQMFYGDTVNASIIPSWDKDYYKFFASAGDTAEVFAYPIGNSTLYGVVEVLDSLGNTGNSYGEYNFYPWRKGHVSRQITTTGTHYVRIRYQGTPSTFPNSMGGGQGVPAIQMGAAGTASSDTGAYQLRLRRFTPSAPSINSWGTSNLASNSVGFYGNLYPNGVTTTVVFQYGPTASYGSSITANESPVPAVIYNLGVNAQPTTLTANTTYHYRMIASSSAGADTSGDATFTTPPTSAQWVMQNSGTTSEFYSVYFPTKNNGIAVGGNCYRTTDGGASWTILSIGGNRVVTFVDTSIGFVAGYYIYKSTDGGATWSSQTNPSGNWMWGISFLNANTGLAIGDGGSLIRTTNGGSTWNIVPSGTTQGLRKVKFVSASVAYAVGYSGTILQSLDGGATWNQLTSGTTNSLYDLWFFDVNNGIVVGGSGMLYRTSDGGGTWTNQQIDPQGYELKAIWFTNANHGLISGDNGRLYRTTNGGGTWNYEETGTRNHYSGLWASSFNRGYLVGSYGTILALTDIPPAAPQSLAAIPANGQVTLSWRKNTDYDLMRYRIYMGNSAAPTTQVDSTTGGASDTSKTITGLVSSATYYFRITAVDSGGNVSPYSNEISLKPSNPPPPPQNLTATLNNGQVTLRWNKVVDANFYRYLIYKGTTSGPTTRVDSTSAGNADTVKTLTGMTVGVRYYFRVTAQAINQNQSAYSNEVSLVITRSAIAEVEPNDSASVANIIFLSDTVRASIYPTGDKDYFKFYASAGDTVEFYVKPISTSTLQGNAELFDSAGNQSWYGSSYFDTNNQAHVIRPIGASGNYFMRIRYQNTPAAFPNTAGGGPQARIPDTQSGAVGIASSDTGAYQLRMQRYVPSAPKTNWLANDNLRYNGVRLKGAATPFGAATTIAFQYGTTTNYGSTVTAAESPIPGTLNTPQVNADIAGLAPGTTYHFRMVSTNSFGADTSWDQTFTTPPATNRWALQLNDYNKRFNSVAFANGSRGFAVGGSPMMTTNGGSSWSPAPTDLIDKQCLLFVDSSRGFAFGYSIHMTTDGGTTWTYQSNPSGYWLYGASVFGPTNGVAVGDNGSIVRTTNGGSSWTQQTSGTTQTLLKVKHASSTIAYAVGTGGTILKSTNSGTSWTPMSSGTTNTLSGVWCFDANNVLVIGNGGILLRTSDGGTTWATRYTGEGQQLTAVAFTNANHGLMTSYAKIYRTVDGGATWVGEESGTLFSFYGLWASSYNRAYVVGEFGTILSCVDIQPSAPQNLSVIPVSGQITLKWNRNTEYDLLRYRIYQGISPAPTVKTDSTTGGMADTSRTITGLDNSTRYYFRVTAVDSSGMESLFSNELNVVPTPAPPAPQNLTASLSAGQVTLKWNKVVDGSFYRYLVYTGTSPSPTTRVDSTTAGNSDTVKTLTGFSVGKRYYFRVTAQNIFYNESQYSNEVGITVTRPAIAEIEPNDSASIATEVFYGDTVNAAINPTGDKDYYKIFAAAGDTVEIFVAPNGSSTLSGYAEVFDSTGSQGSSYGYSYFDSGRSAHVSRIVYNTGTQYVRVRYQGTSATFPNSVGTGPLGGIPPIQSSAAGIASNDTGRYQLRIRRFAPSAPRIYNAYSGGIFSNQSSFHGGLYPNGASTVVTFQYGPTMSYGNSVVGTPNPVPGTLSDYYISANASGLSPNTTYHVRMIATNSAGSDTSSDFTILTPPSTQRWVNSAPNADQWYRGAYFQTATTGLVWGGSVERTTDGASTWSTVPSLYSRNGGTFVDSSNGYLVGYNGYISRTTDGGINWTSQTSSTNYDLWGVAFYNASVGLSVGENGTIVRTTNGGSTWSVQTSGTTYALRKVRFATANLVYAVGAQGTILVSTNGGSSWAAQSSGTSFQIWDVYFFDANKGIAVGEGGLLLRTSNGGATWSKQQIFSNPAYGMSFSNANHGLVAGDYGMLYRTTDGGTTWIKEETGARNSLLGVVAFDYNKAIIAGSGGTILRSVNQAPAPPKNLVAIPIDGQVTLKWDRSNDYDFLRYRIYRGTSPSPTTLVDSTTGGIADTSRTFTGLSNTTPYYFRVTAVDSLGTSSAYSNEIRVVPTPAPAAPQNLTVTFANGQVTLRWKRNTESNFSRYLVYRGTTPGMETQIDSTTGGITDTVKVYTGLTLGTRYFFRITAQNIYFNESLSSNEVDVTITRPAIAEIEPNDSAATATNIVYGDTANAAIRPSSDKDYFKFFASAGDTAEVYAYPRGNSTLYGQIEVYDSTGNVGNRGGNRYFYVNQVAHVLRVIDVTGTHYVRVKWQGTGASFPSSDGGDPQPDGAPQIPTIPTNIVSDDTGSYQIRLQRFTPSPPEIFYAGYYNQVDNKVTLNGGLFMYGSSASVLFEYGTTTSYGSSVSATGSPFQANLGRVDVEARIAGLLPGTTYHFRMIASNVAGSDTSSDQAFMTSATRAPNWTTQNSGTTNALQAVKYLSKTTGVVTSDNVFKTTNAGNTWSSTSFSYSTMYDVFFIDTTNGFGVSYRSVHRTTDGGATWTATTNLSPSWLYGISFADANNGLAVGEGGAILRTTNGGTSWSTQTSGTTGRLRKVRHVSSLIAYAVGVQGTVLKTADGGTTWTALLSPTQGGNEIQNLWFFDALNGIVVSYDAIYKTTDGGTTWSTKPSGSGQWLYGISFSDPLHGIVVGDNGVLLRTLDGGNSWRREQTGTTNTLNAVWVGGYNRAVAVGSFGIILSSVDVPPSAPQNLRALTATGQVTLKWVRNADYDFLRYRIYQGTSPAPTAKVDSTIGGVSDTSKVIAGLNSGLRYYFRITAVDSAGNESPYSNEVTIVPVPPPAAPRNLSVTFAGGLATLKWNKNTEGNFNRYIIYRSTSPAPLTVYDSTTIGSAADTVRTYGGMTIGVRYYFRLTAQNVYLNESQFSNEVSITSSRPAIAEVEPNQSATTATAMVIGDTANGAIRPLDDVDYFKFVAEQNDTVDIFLAAGTNSSLIGRIWVYDSTGNQFIDNASFPSDTSKHSVVALTHGGTYYIRLAYAWGAWNNYPNEIAGARPITPLPTSAASILARSDTGSYRLQLRRFAPAVPDVGWIGTMARFSNSVILNSTVSPNGLTTTVSFQYGLTTSYGNSVASQFAPSSGIDMFGASTVPITGLTPSTTYHYRVVATNSLGTTTSRDLTFRTPPASQTWDFKTIGYDVNLDDVFQTSASTAYAVSYGNRKVYSTTNGGGSWINQTIAVYPHAIAFANSNLGLMVGDRYNTNIVRTTNGGSTWAEIVTPSPFATLYAVQFVTASVVYAAGSNGTILKSTDGGATWSQQTSPTSTTLFGLYFSDANTGTIVGNNGTILRTTNGGAAWNSQTSNAGGYTLRSVWFKDTNNGFATGEGTTLLRTSDAGTTWVKSNPGSAWLWNKIFFSTASNGFIVGDGGQILATTDGGSTWNPQESGTDVWLSSVSTFGRSSIVVGQIGTILTTSAPFAETEPNDLLNQANPVAFGDFVNARINPGGDVDYFVLPATAGDTLEIVGNSVTGSTLQGDLSIVDFATGNELKNAALVTATSQHLIYPVTATGNVYIMYKFRFQPTPADTGAYQLRIRRFGPSAPDIAYIASARNIFSNAATLFSTLFPNGAATTVYYEYGPTVSYGTRADVVGTFTGIATQFPQVVIKGLSANTTYHYRAVATNPYGAPTFSPDFAFTTPAAPDGWVRQQTPTVERLTAASFVTPSVGTAVGLSGKILRTVNGGGVWQTQSSGVGNNLRSVSFVDANKGIAVGSSGRIVGTTDGGLTWIGQTSGTSNSLNGIDLQGAGNGMAVGDGGTILSTSNGGTTWTTQSSGAGSTNLNAVMMFDANNAFVGGATGTLLKTTNAGTNWNPLSVQTAKNINAIWAFSTLNIIVVGDGGLIKKTTDGGITWAVATVTANDLFSIAFADGINGAITGAQGTILRSNDAGSTWKSQSSGTLGDLTGVAYVHPDTLSVVGDFGTIMRYIRQTQVPGTPILASPADLATGRALTDTLRWSSVANAVTYQLQVATNQNFTGDLAVNDSTIVDTAKVVPGLNYNTNYYWHVSARNDVGRGSYSSTRRFTTVGLPIPVSPLLALPANGAGNQSTTPRLRWYTSPYAVNYQLQLSTNQGFTGAGIVVDTVVVDTSVVASRQLDTNTTYYWRVAAKNSSGTSSYPTAFSFTTTSASITVQTNRPSSVTSTSAILSATVNPKGSNTNAYFEWGTTTNYTNQTTSRPVGSGSSPVIVQDTLRNLTTLTTYHYRIVAVLAGSPVSVSGNDQAFVPGLAAPAAPQNLMATLNAQSSVTLNWSDVLSEDGYTVERRLSAGSYAQIGQLPQGGTTYRDSIGLVADSTYYYRVSAFNLAGSTYSDSVRVINKIIPTATFASKKIVFGSREVGFDTFDTTAVVANTGAGKLIVTTPTITGPDASQFVILTGGDPYSELNAGATKSLLIRFAPTSIGEKVAYLKVITNDMQQGTPPGTVLDTLRGTGVDTRSPVAPISAGLLPIGWNNTASFTVNWQGPTDPSGIAGLWYKYDTGPTTGSPGTKATVQTSGANGQATINAPPTSGIHTVYIYLEDGAGNKNTTATSTLTAKFDNTAPAITHNPATVGIVTISGTNVTSSPISITASASKSAGLAGVIPSSFQLQYKRSSDASLTSTSFSGGSAQIPNSIYVVSGQPGGVDYRITVQDSAGNTATSSTYSISVNVVTPPASTFTPPAATTTAGDDQAVKSYRIVSVPYNLSDKKPSTLVNLSSFGPHQDASVDYANWRMQKVSGGGAVVTDYEQFKDEAFFTPGAAAFLIMKTPRAMTVGTGTIVRVDSFNINGLQLQTGWNLLGNPFHFSVSIDSIKAKLTGGTISDYAYYTGTGGTSGWELNNTSAATLKPWEGLAVKTTGSPVIRFELPPALLASQREQIKPVPPKRVEVSIDAATSWLIKFDAERLDNHMRQSNTMVGMVPDADQGRDAYDWSVPPLVGIKNVAVYFKNAQEALIRDIRPVSEEGETWETKMITGDRGARIKLTFEDLPKFTNPAFRAFLIDMDEKMAFDIETRPTVEFNSKEGLRNFRLVVGTLAYVQQNSGGVDLLPKTMTLYQNYPNPFNPETIIRYTVPGTKPSFKVTLKVFNLLGQEVRTIVDGDQKAGYYEVSMSGKGLSSGTYIYRISVSDGSREQTFMDVKKMILLK